MKRGIIGGIVALIVVTLVPGPEVHAASSTVVIRSVQAIGAAKGTDGIELIEIENRSDQPVDVTNWSLAYSSASGATLTVLTKFLPLELSTHLMLDKGAREMIASTDYSATLKDKTGLITFTSGMYHLGGSVILRDASGASVDTVGWGTATKNVETKAAPALAAGLVLRRSDLADTDDNSLDFSSISQASAGAYTFGQLREEIDACSNIEGNQSAIPTGLIRDAMGRCVAPFIPAKLKITELFPNPRGADTGHEFVEIFNPETTDVVLEDYALSINGKSYGFPDLSVIKAGSYMAFSDDDLGVTLPNTTGVVVTLLAQGESIDQSEGYQKAPTDETWAWFESGWQFTNQPTPNAANIVRREMTSEEDDTDTALLAACKDGYYRYEVTNRCRKIPTIAAPAPCKEGQYRSEETGRCRSIALTAAASLKPCADDQFRNPATGRCKKIASTDDLLKPCKDGYERNPETNRCRKALLSTMPAASFPVEPIQQAASDMGIWWALGGVLAAAVGYGAWEWRSEIVRILRRALGVISFGRL